MRFPRQRVRFAASYDGKTETQGFILLDIKGLDIEGVNTLAIPVADIETARAKGDQQGDAMKKARELLGG